MTSNQIQYWSLVEQARHNRVTEREATRHNYADEELRDFANRTSRLDYVDKSASGYWQSVAQSNYGSALRSVYEAWDTDQKVRSAYWSNYKTQVMFSTVANLVNGLATLKNAETNAANANVNAFNAIVGAVSAIGNLNVARRNASVNEQNADTNAHNASVNALNALTNWYNAETNRGNLVVNQENATTNRQNAATNALNAATNQQNANTAEARMWTDFTNGILGSLGNIAHAAGSFIPK